MGNDTVIDFGINEKNFNMFLNKTPTLKGFTSTSLKEDSGIQGRDLMIKMIVPAGDSGGMYIKNIVSARHKYQEEVLFARGLTIQIKNIKLIESGYYIEAEVVKI